MYAEATCQPWLPQVVKAPFNVQLISAPPSTHWGNAPSHSPLDSWEGGGKFSMVSLASQSLLWICQFLPEVPSKFVLLKHYSHERLYFHFSLSCIGEGNGNPLQCSCLENPRDGGAWWAAVYGVAQNQTRLK